MLGNWKYRYSRDASFQAEAWIQALAIYFQAVCFIFYVYKLKIFR